MAQLLPVFLASYRYPLIPFYSVNSLLLPVRPHVLKYLQFHLGERYFLSEADHIGLFLFQLLRRPLTNARYNHVLTAYKGLWHVGLGSYEGRGLGEPTSKSIFLMDKFVHELLLAEMHAFVELAVDHGQQAKFAIEGFMLKYGLREEEVQFDTLKKSWQRYLRARRDKRRVPVSLAGRLPLKDLASGLKKVHLSTANVA